jgi:hypothetical protein
MTRFVLTVALLTTTLALTLPAAATNLTRTFVSAAGSDSNPCTITQPCASFAHAYSVTAASGIIAALDPGKYGPVTITGPITINGYGWAAITAPATGTAITITAGASDTVTLNGLEIDGASAGYNGIVFNSGGSLTVTDSTLQNFAYSGSGNTTGNGILMAPTSGTIQFVIANTRVSNNAYAGIFYLPPSGTPTANIVVDHVVATANVYAIQFNTTSATGGTTIAAVSNSVASDSSQVGIYALNTSQPLTVAIDNTSIIGNVIGIYTSGTAKILLGRSVITGNSSDGVSNNTAPNTFYTYQNNQINLNGTDIAGSSLNTTFALQ